jgi:hypothetical protein
MKRLVAAGRYDDALKYGDPYFDVDNPDFRRAYERASEQVTKQAEAKARAMKKKEGVSIGMSQQDVLDSSWGRPRKINTTTNAYGSREQWVYDGGYLYFENGVLTSIQN